MNKTVKVLVIDGGGARGIVPVWFAAELEKRTGKPCCELFDLIGGVSVGSLVGLCLTVPDPQNPTKPKFKAEEMADLFTKDAKTIFHMSFWQFIRSLGGLIRPKYSSKGMQKVTKRLFGDTLLGQALTDVIVPSYNVKDAVPYIFKNFKAYDDPSENYKMADIGWAACSGPSLIELPKLINSNNTKNIILADGGMVAYNVALSIWTEAKKLYPDADNIMIVSLGTGTPNMGVKGDVTKWGMIRWFFPMMKCLLWGGLQVMDQFLDVAMNSSKQKNYYRFQPIISDDKVWAIDDFSQEQFDYLKKITDAWIEKNNDYINEVCHKLTNNQSMRALRLLNINSAHDRVF